MTDQAPTPPILPPKKSIWTRWWMIVIYTIVGIGVIANLFPAEDDGDTTAAPTTLEGAPTTDAEEPTTTVEEQVTTTLAPTSTTLPPTTTTLPSTTTSLVDSHGIGDSVETSSLRFTLEGVSYPETDVLDLEPEPGMRYIVFEGVIELLSGDDESVSSLLMFEARTPDGRSWDQDIFVADPSLDGDALPGLPVRGGVGFQIPEDEPVVFLIVSLDLFGGVDGVYEVEVTP